MPRKPKPIAEQLRAAIRAAERRGVTMAQVAKSAGVERSQISRLMAGERLPSLPTTDKIAAALGKRIVLADSC